jgi:hypothetical protein
MKLPYFRALVAIALAGCNVPEPPRSHGIEGDASTFLDAGAASACSRAVIVAESDYASTNVAVLAPSGAVLTDSIASSATSSVGLAAPLSGDVVLPTMPVRGSEVVLVDRGKDAGRILWVDPRTTARRELSVATGFYSNPHDYVAISRTRAYVTRYEANPTPGREPFDAGNDVLVIDPTKPSIEASIDLTPALGSNAARALPRPDKIVVVGGRAFVLLGVTSGTFATTAASRIAVLDTATDRVGDVVALDGFEGCFGLALAPSGKELAVLCGGKDVRDEATRDLSKSGVVLVDVTGSPKVSKSFRAADFGDGPVGFFGAYAAPRSLLFQTFGYNATSGASADDLLVQLDLDAGTSSVVLRSAGEAFTLGGVTCDLGCGACFAADAKRQGGVVHRFDVDGAGALGSDRLIKPETRPGLPARYLGLF